MPVYPRNKLNMGNTPNNSGRFRAGQPRFLVQHYTAGGSGKGSAEYLFKAHSPASSAHFVVDRNGDVYQLADTSLVTWHAGQSAWRGLSFLNQYSIGIEFANLGYWRPGIAKFKAPLVAAHRNGGPVMEWEPYPEKQILAGLDLTKWLCEVHPTLVETVGHDDIAPKRKLDPGPAFPMERFRDVVTPDSADTPRTYVVNTDDLNLRGGAGTGYAVIARLDSGAKVKMLQDGSPWDLVEAPGGKRGWVHGAYLTPA